MDLRAVRGVPGGLGDLGAGQVVIAQRLRLQPCGVEESQNGPVNAHLPGMSISECHHKQDSPKLNLSAAGDVVGLVESTADS